MILQGKHTKAEVFTDVIDQAAISQVIDMCNLEAHKDCQIAIMPDVHAGDNCTIGTTIAFNDKVIPNLVGDDIGCGVTVQPITLLKEIDWINDFDVQVQKVIPAGPVLREKDHPYLRHVNLNALRCVQAVGIEKVSKSLGTLGGGNHYIEVDYDSQERYYLVVHSGSRSLGKYVCKYYQELAYKTLNNFKDDIDKEVKAVVAELIAQNKKHEIEPAVKAIHQKYAAKKTSKDMAYLEGQNLEDYLHDMNIAVSYAYWSRKAIIDEIIKAMSGRMVAALPNTNYCFFSTMHNYIDTKRNVIRKGAVSAERDELLIIPISMTDGAIICKGKGNPDWNHSAPHGAGRLMSRSVAKQEIDLELFEESMKGIFSTSVCESTIDESCFAYKNLEDIVNNIGDTVDIVEIVKPIYNYKAH